MKIGLISDTHDHVPHIKKAVEIFRQKEVEKVIHAGDYCSPFTISHFKGMNLKGIFGNNDGDKYLLIKKFQESDAEIHGDFMSFNIDKLKLAVYHGTYSEITEALINCGKYDVVISGHTHETVHKKVGETIVINPGTAHGFENKATIAILDTNDRTVEIITLN